MTIFYFCFISEIWLKNPACFAFIFDASSAYDKVQKRRCLYSTTYSRKFWKIRISSDKASRWLVTNRPIRWNSIRQTTAFSEDIRIFQKFLEYFVLYKHRLFCTLSYPEDASKINAKHAGFFNQISEMKQKFL